MKKNIALSLLTGIMFALALPPFKTGFIAYFALIPFFLLLENKSYANAARWGYLAGFCIAVLTLFWVGWVTLPGMFGAFIAWPLATTLYAVVHVFLLKRLGSIGYLFVPFIWTTIEYLESFSEMAFPWNYIGYTQSYYFPLIQYAEFTAIYGVSFWVVLLNVLFLLMWKSRRTKKSVIYAATIVLLFLAPLLHGILVLDQAESEKEVKIAIIQGNRDPMEKWSGDVKETNFNIYADMTRKAFTAEPDLVIWPETAMPFYLRSERQYVKKIHALIDSMGTSLLTGAIDYEYLEDGGYDHFNAAMLIEPYYYSMQTYWKMKLVMFSEKVPYKNYFPFNVLKELLWDLGLGDYGIGGEVKTLNGRFRASVLEKPIVRKTEETSDYKTGVAICYESVFPNHVRTYVNKGANFLIIITNDAWFGDTSGPHQHQQMAVFRAIENRRDIARCANTGISCFIDKFGRVRMRTPFGEPAIIDDHVKLYDEQTFYSLHGNVFAVFLSVVSLLALAFAVIRKI